MELKIGNDTYLRAASSFIRMKVFVLERSLTLEAEFDSNDTPETIYSVLFDGNLPIATARLLKAKEDTARIGRVATLAEYRGKQLGSRVVTALEKLAFKQDVKQIMIHAELTAATFYETLDYQIVGEPYSEDGVSCITLTKFLGE